MKYVYPAIFYYDREGGYYVDFPDLAGTFTFGETLYEAIIMAEDVLALSLSHCEENNTLVEPTPIKEILAAPEKYYSEDYLEYSTGAFVILIRADTEAYDLLCAEMAMLY